MRAILCQRAHIALAEGRPEAAADLTDKLLSIELAPARESPIARIQLALLLVDLDRTDDVELPRADARAAGPWLNIEAAIVEGRLEEAADRLAELGLRPMEAAARQRAAARLIGAGRRAEADAQLHRALAFWHSVGATRYIREGEALLAATA